MCCYQGVALFPTWSMTASCCFLCNGTESKFLTLDASFKLKAIEKHSKEAAACEFGVGHIRHLIAVAAFTCHAITSWKKLNWWSYKWFINASPV